MHKIDAPHATADHEFTDGNPATGIEATELISKWHNTMQREVIAPILAAGLTLSDTEDDQLLEAIQTILAAHANLTGPHGATSFATALRLVLRDSAGRAQFAAGVAGGDAVVVSQLAGAWITPPVGSGWLNDTSNPLRYRSVMGGCAVQFTGMIHSGGGGGNTIVPIDGINAGCRPTSQQMDIPILGQGAAEYNYITIKPDGSIVAPFANGNCICNFTAPIS